jgi:hypothetical protein
VDYLSLLIIFLKHFHNNDLKQYGNTTFNPFTIFNCNGSWTGTVIIPTKLNMKSRCIIKKVVSYEAAALLRYVKVIDLSPCFRLDFSSDLRTSE